MHRLVISLLLVSSSAVAKSYMDNKQTVTQDCAKDPVASIMGNDNTITLVGTCTTISVTGNKNKVTVASAKDVAVTGNENTVDVEATDTLSTTGNKNTVTWKKGISGEKPAVRNPGKDNKISKK